MYILKKEEIFNMADKISIDSFTLLTVIGKGSYAKVILVKKNVKGNHLSNFRITRRYMP